MTSIVDDDVVSEMTFEIENLFANELTTGSSKNFEEQIRFKLESNSF